MTPARRISYQILAEVRQGRRLDRALAGARVAEADRGWVHELTYGVARFRGRLDHLLEPHLDRGLASLPEPVRLHLEMGLYQLLYMDSVPDYAAVSQTVAGVRAVVGPGLAPLTNAVLRRAQEAGGSSALFPDAKTDPVGHLASWGSHPRWLVERWVERWGADQAGRVVDANNRVPEVSVRPIRTTLPEAVAILEGRGIHARAVGLATPCLVIDPARRVAEALDAIEGFAQDPAAALVATYAAFEPGSRVADLCAAPGGKALAIASEGVQVIASDLSPARIRLVRQAAVRLGASVSTCVGDAARAPFGQMDGVLLDVPCTGTGTMRRHPDTRWKLSSGAMGSLVDIQARLLEAAAHSVRVGGTLVYATCSLESEENEGQVERFLTRHPEFTLKSPPPRVSEPISSALGSMREGFLSLLPTDTGYDGAFAARMVRIR